MLQHKSTRSTKQIRLLLQQNISKQSRVLLKKTRDTHQKPALHPRHVVRVSSDSEPTGQMEGIQSVHLSRFCLTHSHATSRATSSSTTCDEVKPVDVSMRQHTSASERCGEVKPARAFRLVTCILLHVCVCVCMYVCVCGEVRPTSAFPHSQYFALFLVLVKQTNFCVCVLGKQVK